MGYVDLQEEITDLRLELERLQREVEEHRARRLAIEEEFAAVENTWRSREPEIRYIDRYLERSPYAVPMPPQQVKGPVRYVSGPIVYVEKPTTIFVHTPRQAGPLGRFGDFLDRLLRLAPH